jgi:hypothetical protein
MHIIIAICISYLGISKLAWALYIGIVYLHICMILYVIRYCSTRYCYGVEKPRQSGVCSQLTFAVVSHIITVSTDDQKPEAATCRTGARAAGFWEVGVLATPPPFFRSGFSGEEAIRAYPHARAARTAARARA